MMLLRVPIGVAMGLVGVGGFAAIAGWEPALNLLAQSPIRTVTDFNLSLIPFFVLMGVLATESGMSQGAVPDRPRLVRPLPGRAWRSSTIGACARLRRDLRLLGRDRGDHDARSRCPRCAASATATTSRPG